MYRRTLFLITVLCLWGFVSTDVFKCYTCSYGEQDGDLRDCITHPEALGRNAVRNCNRSCVFQEQYDIHKDQVTSYFRSCGDDIGNECSKDYTHVTCKGSCQGDFCNQDQTGTRYKPYLRTHQHGGYGSENGCTMVTCSILLFLSCIMFSLCVLL